MALKRDRRYGNGRWEPFDFLADCPDGTPIDKWLFAEGWEGFFSFGEHDGVAAGIATWARVVADEAAELRSHCDCGVRVRVLWSGPIGPDSRPVLLVCGHHPRSQCEFRHVIREDALRRPVD